MTPGEKLDIVLKWIDNEDVVWYATNSRSKSISKIIDEAYESIDSEVQKTISDIESEVEEKPQKLSTRMW